MIDSDLEFREARVEHLYCKKKLDLKLRGKSVNYQ